jgi:hypothetical protein
MLYRPVLRARFQGRTRRPRRVALLPESPSCPAVIMTIVIFFVSSRLTVETGEFGGFLLLK